MIRVWHFAFCRWYDHDRAGHPRRAALWGQIADRLVHVGERVGWGSDLR